MAKFGIVLWKTVDLQPYTYRMAESAAVAADSLGFDHFFISDHFQGPDPQNPQLECFSTLASLAPVTKRIRLGSLVACVSYRTPSMLAKICANIDHASRGRVDLGMGAGWDVKEYEANDIVFPGPAERIARLEEAIRIVKGLWMERELTYKGRYYKTDHAVCEPRPLQEPHPPIWVGAKGQKMLELTARHADGWNIDTAFTPEACRAKIRELDEACRRTGRSRPIAKSAAVEVVLGTTREKVESTVERAAAAQRVSREDYLRERIVGTPEAIVPVVRAFVGSGLDLLVCGFMNSEELGSFELFADKVVPEL